MEPSLLCDWRANAGSTKSRVVLVLFRLANRLRADPRVPGPLAAVYGLGYQVVASWLLGVELLPGTSVGPGLRMLHPLGIVVNRDAVIGRDCTIRCSTTLGNTTGPDGEDLGAPTLGDGVELGANVCVIGPVTVGARATIGAGAVVVHDIAPGATAVGNPAREISRPADLT